MIPNNPERFGWEKVNPVINDKGEITYGWLPPVSQRVSPETSKARLVHGLEHITDSMAYGVYLKFAIEMGVEVYIVCGDDKLTVSKRGVLYAINSKGQLQFKDGTLLALASSIVELYVGMSTH